MQSLEVQYPFPSKIGPILFDDREKNVRVQSHAQYNPAEIHMPKIYLILSQKKQKILKKRYYE
jgi:hypothetical protein